MNSINIIGTMVRDQENKFLPSGSQVGSFAIAVNQDYLKDGVKVEKVSFFDVKTFGKNTENISKFFHKGSRIGINGELEQEQWTDQQSGQKRSRVIIKLSKFTFIDRKSDNQGGQPQQQQSGYNPPVPAQGYNNQGGQQYNTQTPQQQPAMNQELPIIDVDKDEIPF